MRVRSSLGAGTVLVALATSLTGCSRVHHDDPTTPTSTTTTAPAPATTVVPGPLLVSAGAEPQQKLRLRLTAASTTTLAITTDLAVIQDAASGPQTVDPPPIVQTLRQRVGRVRPDGTSAITFRVMTVGIGEDNALTPSESLELTTALQPLRGIRGSGRLTPQGRVSDVRFTVPPGLPTSVASQVSTLRSQVESLAASLPTEAVGVGGSWRTDSTTVLGGVTVKQAVTTRITAIEGDIVRYSATSTALAARQPLPPSDLPAGATATLASSSLTGTAEGELDLRSLRATSTTSLAGTQVVEVQRPGSPVATLHQRVAVTTRSESRT